MLHDGFSFGLGPARLFRSLLIAVILGHCPPIFANDFSDSLDALQLRAETQEQKFKTLKDMFFYDDPEVGPFLDKELQIYEKDSSRFDEATEDTKKLAVRAINL